MGARYCWAHVDDVARGHVLAMDKGRPGESYILAGEPYGLVDALDLAEGITGVPAPRVRLPAAPVKAVAKLVERLERYVPLPATYRSESLRGCAGVTYLARSDKARRELGWTCRPFEEGLRQTLTHEMSALGLVPPS
jgi:nucleoside-diphosphate-sugar epimerase